MITNAALIVFREGLEAILIIAAITASMVGANRELRRPILRGALLALPASIALFFAADAAPRLALAVRREARGGGRPGRDRGPATGPQLVLPPGLLDRVDRRATASAARSCSPRAPARRRGAAGPSLGLYLLGFTSVFREGFETVLFLQALQLSSGTGIVLAGVSLGLLATAAVGALTFTLERKLPYKKMLIVTGVLIALVLVVLVGNTVRTLQGVGWMPITPIDVEFPLWMGTWLGVFPTVETLVAQVARLRLRRRQLLRRRVGPQAQRQAQLRRVRAKPGRNGADPGSRERLKRIACRTREGADHPDEVLSLRPFPR